MDFIYEQQKLLAGFTRVAGCDEAGRGPMAGPIVAGAVIFDTTITEHVEFCGLLNDSKKLSEKKRDYLYDAVLELAADWAAGIVSATEIDEQGIAWANHECVRRAVAGLTTPPDFVATDYIARLHLPIPYDTIKKGDATVLSIAAASIIAKVRRDRMMYEFDMVFPEYGFAQHKGYGTKQHRAAIEAHGLCDIHRKSFTFK